MTPTRRWTPRARRTLLVLTLCALMAGLTLTLELSQPSTADTGSLTWSDEFNGPAGAAPDPNKWRHDVGGHGWGNEELQYYTDGAQNTWLDGNGNLIIEARPDTSGKSCHYGDCEFTSGRLLTLGTFAQTYGRFEVRMKIPGGQGLWPAFWMLGDDIEQNPWPTSGEIDVMENIGREPATVWGGLHGPGYTGAQASNGSYTLSDGAALSDNFHTYAVEWSPGHITWYLDDVAYVTKTPADVPGEWVFDKPFFMVLNLAVGGAWPGSPDESTQFPAQMVVDYVRVYRHNPATTPPTHSPSPTTPPEVSPPVTSQIRGYQNKCIDVVEGSANAGTPLHLWDCYSNLPSQQWTAHPDGTLRALDLCMDTQDHATTNGTPLQLSTCDGSPSQQFTLNASQDLVQELSQRCIDVADWNPNNGATLHLWDCAGTANQKWWAIT